VPQSDPKIGSGIGKKFLENEQFHRRWRTLSREERMRGNAEPQSVSKVVATGT